ncbi:MAG: 3-deoxy-D-manno-octulosonic acid transferase [Alphaproteobacteria bacterium]
MIAGLYRGLTTLGGPFIGLYLRRRRARGKEDHERFPERLGIAGRSRPPGPLVWLHAASVGESLSTLPLVSRLIDERPGLSILVTTGTVTSARLMAERLPERAIHQYLAVDRVAYVRRFLDHWRPDLILWTESEFWPNTLIEAAHRAIPLVLVQGRISDRSFRGWQRYRRFIGRLLSGFALCLGQTETDRERLERLGAPRAECLGNLKFAAPPLPADPAELARLSAVIANRPVWLAASTHAGEEAAVARIHRLLEPSLPGLLTIIVPRHPARGADIAAELTAMGLPVERRSAGGTLRPDTRLYLADTMGELGLFFRLAGVAFMGKSLVPLGGQNPLEPARLGCAVLFGPHMGNFTEIAGRMLAAGAAREVADEATLARAVRSLLLEAPAARRAMGEAGRAFATAEAGVLDRVVARLSPFVAVAEETHRAGP